jgi:N-acyl-D-amino-acid deacylase
MPRAFGLLRVAAVVLIGGAGLGLAAPSGAPTSFDVVIAGGRVVDGTGAPWFRADVGLVGDHITRIGDLHGATAKRRIDATSLVVAPGFIDMLGQSEFNVLVDHRAASKILQGVTTEGPGRALRGPGYKR